MNQPEISVVIPSYNRRDDVLRLLADATAQEDVATEIIVVDDASPDGSADAVTAAFPNVRVIRNEVNSGPCVSRNRGILAATAPFIAGFDSDVTLPDRRLLRRIIDTFHAQPGATALSLRILRPDGVSEDVERWWHPAPVDAFASKWFETDYFCGTGCAFRRHAVMAAGLFPEILYMHYEEVELAFRLLDLGGTIFHAPELAVLHHASPKANRGRIQKFYKPRNQILLALHCLPWGRAARFLLPRLAFNFSHALRGGYIGEFVEALASARQLAPARLATRSPLKESTLARMDAMRRRGGLLLRLDRRAPLTA